ncbi:MAG TPA: hypothetical protein VHH35_03915 [Pyrinomonadaceae bacterium]|nr:hypothetical protein [Pyrinomonadaceae bacterium]
MDTIKKREDEATSKETLEDIEESEETPSTGAPDDDDGPSPDGALDEPKELHDADPM